MRFPLIAPLDQPIFILTWQRHLITNSSLQIFEYKCIEIQMSLS